jgi:hypothetical protein
MAKKKAAEKKEEEVVRDDARFIVQNPKEKRLVNSAALPDAIDEMSPCMVYHQGSEQKVMMRQFGKQYNFSIKVN